ncbi:DUF4124 domain-containing protein [Marinobacteraceae bacterium S3BR75-40.1]
MKIRLLALAMLLGLTLPGLSWSGSVYKWVDENGVVHYGDQQPHGKQSEKMRVRTTTGGPSPSASATEPPQPDQEAETPKSNDNGNQAADEKSPQKNEEACQQARKNLEIIQNNARIRIEENGEKRYLTPEEIEQKKQEMQKIIDEAC